MDDDADGLRRVGLDGVWWVVCVCWAWFAWLACFACFAWERVVTILLLDCCWSGYGFLDSRMWQVCCGWMKKWCCRKKDEEDPKKNDNGMRQNGHE